jgi:hypothetical protein
VLSELSEIKKDYEITRNKYKEYFSRVDPALLDDLLQRQMEHPDTSMRANMWLPISDGHLVVEPLESPSLGRIGTR